MLPDVARRSPLPLPALTLAFVVLVTVGCTDAEDGGTPAAMLASTAAVGSQVMDAGPSTASGPDTAGMGTSGSRRFRVRCTEPPVKQLTCGALTCPELDQEELDSCVAPCCLMMDGQPYCGKKSTFGRFGSECALPGQPDPSCDEVVQFQGCCDTVQHKCGVYLPMNAGCVTQSGFVTLPETPKRCGDATDDDAGAPTD